ncbi:MAG TPA: DMT family transporter [Rectinema sp.]|nr:DMT family transporter [Rectinema sp.]
MRRCYFSIMNRMGGILAGLGYSTIFGFSFLMTKEALEVLNPMELLAMRFIIAALLMSILVISGIIQVDFKGKPIGLLALMCLFQPIAYFTFETYGLANAATNVAGIILGALPAGVAIMEALLLKERLSALQSAGLSISIVGVILVAVFGQGHNTETKPIGIIFLTGSMLSAVFFNIASKKAAESFSPVERTFAMMWSAAICFFIPALFENIKGKGNISHLFGEWNRIAGVWGGILYLGILSSVGAFFLINYSLSQLKASQSAVFTNLVTVITVLAGVLIRKEQFSWSQGLSVILIILGIAVVNSSFKEKAKS